MQNYIERDEYYERRRKIEQIFSEINLHGKIFHILVRENKLKLTSEELDQDELVNGIKIVFNMTVCDLKDALERHGDKLSNDDLMLLKDEVVNYIHDESNQRLTVDLMEDWDGYLTSLYLQSLFIVYKRDIVTQSVERIAIETVEDGLSDELAKARIEKFSTSVSERINKIVTQDQMKEFLNGALHHFVKNVFPEMRTDLMNEDLFLEMLLSSIDRMMRESGIFPLQVLGNLEKKRAMVIDILNQRYGGVVHAHGKKLCSEIALHGVFEPTLNADEIWDAVFDIWLKKYNDSEFPDRVEN